MRQIEVLHRRLVEQGPQGAIEQILFQLLALLAKLYSLVISLRDFTFRSGLRKSFRSRLPVVAVGNLAVGGTGKTPMVDLLIRYVQQKGLRVAVVSRGYAGSYAGDLGVVSLGGELLMSAKESGDEPSLLSRRNPDAIVLVAAKRRIAIEYIEEHGCADLIILDDAFQHRQVARDLNLLLLDAKRPFGNSRLLPAGLLREKESAVARADLIFLTGAADGMQDFSSNKPVLKVGSSLAQQAVSLDGEKLRLESFIGRKIVAFAGIARPERFFSALEARGLQLSARLALGDHASYDDLSFDQIKAAAMGADLLLTTEKDAVKLTASDFDLPCFSVGLEISLENDSALFDRLDPLLKKDDAMPLPTELMEILACPKCKEKVSLKQVDDTEVIICSTCRLAYPVRDGIPVMLIDEAQSLGD